MHMDIRTDNIEIASQPVYMGGPVQNDRGFVLHEPPGNWEATLKVTAAGRGPRNALVTLGYAGWGAGQLEQELASNTWLSGPASADIVFRTPPERRWLAAAELIGVDLHLLSSEPGHA